MYVFDDCDPDETEYLGCAKVPLIPLAHDKTINGTFELRRVSEGKLTTERRHFYGCLLFISITTAGIMIVKLRLTLGGNIETNADFSRSFYGP